MMDLEELTSEELSEITRQAGRECELRLRRIAEASDPLDLALRNLLGAMANEAVSEVRCLMGDADADQGGHDVSSAIREFIRASIPSLVKKFGEGALHRDVALFYAESLEEEVSRFFRMLAAHAREARARSVYAELSDRGRTKLRYLREVVLAG